MRLEKGIIFYGPPASGKDTVSNLLERTQCGYAIYKKLKVGGGKTETYRMTSEENLQHLEAAGHIIYLNRRYGNSYAIDSNLLDILIENSIVPIVHIGQCEALLAVNQYPLQWTQILLWCPRAVTAERARGRNDTDLHARLEAWDATIEDLKNNPQIEFDLAVRTDLFEPPVVAESILNLVRGERRTRISVSDLFASGLFYLRRREENVREPRHLWSNCSSAA
jgi:guanylate kinase